MLCDCHTHLSDYTPQEVPHILECAREADVTLIVSASTTLETSRASVELARNHRPVFAGVGLHPTELTGLVQEETYQALYELARSEPKVVCVSETGLDFTPQSPPRELQYEAFRRQIRLAIDLGLPIVFHSREAHPEVLSVLREEGAERVGGVMHYFQADLATAQEAIACGFLVSLAKPLLRLPALQQVAAKLPLDHLVLETDAVPQPWKRHRRNWAEPWQVKLVAEKLAELKDLTLEEVAQVTTANARRILKLK